MDVRSDLGEPAAGPIWTLAGECEPVARASDLDERLRRLGRREALCRLALGRDAAPFLLGKGHHRLGFACLGDYTRERLGISARELQSLVRVAAALTYLPRLARSLVAGEISWTKLRILVDVARPESESAWLDRARGCTAEALRAAIRAELDPYAGAPADDYVPRTVSTPPSGQPSALGTGAADDDTIDGEEPARFRLTCSRYLRRNWRGVLELARSMAGEQAPVWHAAEAIAAEGLSGAPRRPASTGGRAVVLRELLVSSPAPLPSAGPTPCAAVAGSTASSPAADGAAPSPADTVLAPAPDRAHVPPGSGVASNQQGAPGATGTVGSSPLEDTDPASGAGHGLAAPLAASDPVVLDARMRATLVELRTLDARTGAALRAAIGRRLHRRLGFPSIAAYARDRLGISAGKARTLLALDRRTRRVPPLGEAYRRGELSWVRALTILPVAADTQAAAWVARAGEVTVRRLEAEVSWALDAFDTHPDAGIPAPPAETELAPGTLTAPACDVALEVPLSAAPESVPAPASAAAPASEAVPAPATAAAPASVPAAAPAAGELAAETAALDGTPEVVPAVDSSVASPAEGGAGAGSGAMDAVGATPAGACRPGAGADPAGRQIGARSTDAQQHVGSRAAPFGDGRTATGPGPGPGRQIGARSTAAATDATDAAGALVAHFSEVEITFVGPRSVVALLYEAVSAYTRPREPRWRGMARLLGHVRGEWLGQPRHRDPVFARDGWRCMVPGCGARRALHDHHLRFRSRGGGNGRENRISVCAWHHLRGIHGGAVRAAGTAPNAVTWELGVDRRGRAWKRLHGDRYLHGDGSRGPGSTRPAC